MVDVTLLHKVDERLVFQMTKISITHNLYENQETWVGTWAITTSWLLEWVSRLVKGLVEALNKEWEKSGKRLFSELNNQRVIQNPARWVDVSFG